MSNRRFFFSPPGGGMFNKFGSLGPALQEAYPEVTWDNSKFSLRGKKSAQRWLYVKLEELIPKATIVEDFHHPDLVWEKEMKSKHMQLDIWIAEYNLALEYQGEHHYFNIPTAYGPGDTLKTILENDAEKRQKCIQKGISLVSIPYWWDGSVDSLSSTLNEVLPHIFPKTNSPPIPKTQPKDKTVQNNSTTPLENKTTTTTTTPSNNSNTAQLNGTTPLANNNNDLTTKSDSQPISNSQPTADYFPQVTASPTVLLNYNNTTTTSPKPTPSKMPRVKKFSIESHIMQGLDWNNEDPTGWTMSEKLDGIRAYWDGTQFWSKRGKEINIPQDFKDTLPGFPLDGELWAGYEEGDKMNAKSKAACGMKRGAPLDMSKFKFCVFDTPEEDGVYQERHLFLQNYFVENPNPNVLVIPIQTCQGLAHLQEKLQEIIKRGGEGIMIYHPENVYFIGRTNSLLKVKHYIESNVKYLRLNENSYAYVCEQKNGQISIVKCFGSDYHHPPPVGTVVTASHIGFFTKSGKLKHPTLVDIREDLNWDEINKE